MAYVMMQLTNQQLQAVEHPGNLLLQACPGSGKTRTIVARLIRDIENFRDTPYAAACITYTNSAVSELEERIAPYLHSGDDRHYVISTIHAFCLNEILRPFASRVPGFRGAMFVLARDRPEFKEIADYAATQIGWLGLNYWDYERFGGLSLNAAGELTGEALKDEQLKRAAPHFWRRCDELGFIDFANIIYRSYCLLRDDPQVSHSLACRFKAFLVDEFQDTSELQIKVLEFIHAQKRSRLFLVGDVAQSVYGFAGAMPELILPFGQHIGARTDLSLSKNFRSNPAIVQQSNRLFPRIPSMTSEGQQKSCLETPSFLLVNDTFDAIMTEFLPLLARLEIPFGRAAILARNWATLLSLARSLRQAGIPVVGPGARPYRRSRLFATLAEQLCGAVTDGLEYNVRQLERSVLHAVQDITGHRRSDIFSYEGRIVVVRLLREAKHLAAALGAVAWLEEMSVVAGRILQQGGWIDSAHVYLFRSSVEEMKADMRDCKEDMANLSIDDLGMFASPSRAIKLLSIHNAKGHEYTAVALIGARERTLPDYRSLTKTADIEAEKRLFYVGVTRAERVLMYISERDRWGNGPSRFLGPAGVGMVL